MTADHRSDQPSSVEDLLRKLYNQGYFDQIQAGVYMGYGSRGVDSKEVTTEAFIRAFERADEIRKPRQWLWREALNIAHRKCTGRPPSISMADRSISAALGGIAPPRIIKALEAIDSLSQNMKIAFLCLEVFGMERQDVAELLGCKGSTVRAHLWRAKRALSRKNIDTAELQHFVTDLEGGSA